jgi:spermidine synthase
MPGQRAAHPPSRFLRGSGVHAVIEPDALTPGACILAIGGAEQSHVDLGRPENVFYEYLRRIAHVLDIVRPAGEPVRVLHLGAGALTLARYIQATRPGSAQEAVELERELLDFVLAHLPLPEGTRLATTVADARDAAARHRPASIDAVVLDIFAGADAPPHLACAAFYAELLSLVKDHGVVLVNVGDDPPLAFAREQARQLRGVATDAALLADAAMVTGRYPGNVVLAATNGHWSPDWTTRLLEAGPHPAAVLTGMDFDAFCAERL